MAFLAVFLEGFVKRFFEQVIKMLMMVVALFTLAWLPLQLYDVLNQIFTEINKYVLCICEKRKQKYKKTEQQKYGKTKHRKTEISEDRKNLKRRNTEIRKDKG